MIVVHADSLNTKQTVLISQLINDQYQHIAHLSYYHIRIMESSVISALLWGSIPALPLVFTTQNTYEKVFPAGWYDVGPRDSWNTSIWPSPLGLTLGLLAVVVGQIFVLLYFWARRSGYLGKLTAIQKEGAPPYDFNEGLTTHLGQPEGFVMLGGYLIAYWMLGLMPASYYSFGGGINWVHVMVQLLIQDFVQYLMHVLEHKLDPRLYKASHKPHHRFTNPRLFDAFNGSPTDTLLMILLPLLVIEFIPFLVFVAVSLSLPLLSSYLRSDCFTHSLTHTHLFIHFCLLNMVLFFFQVTSRCVNANVWSYMAFGSLYANWLTLIHAEYAHPWDWLFRCIGFGTAADHHVHHKLFNYNFGHLFMYWDRIFGTYRSPTDVSLFNKEI